MLKGTYYFREVVWQVGDYSGDLSDAAVLYGTVTFDGNGSYRMSATGYDYYGGGLQGNPTGQYSVAANGHGFLSNPLLGGNVYGVVSQQGIFIGSTTEDSANNDLFIAAPVSSPLPTAATFKGQYWIAAMDLSSLTPAGASSSLFQFNPDGAGNLGTIAGTGYVGQNGTTMLSQNNARLSYSFVNGAGVFTFPNYSNAAPFFYGQKYLYISPDGNFVFGGSPGGFDMFVGVRTGGSPNLSGVYDQAGVDEDDSNLGNGYGVLSTYYGSLGAASGSIVAHQRINDVFQSNAYDYTYSDGYSVKSDGTYSSPAMRYVVGAGGVRIGSGIGPYLGLNVAIPAPAPSGQGVFLNPLGVVNVASSAPFTAGIAPGEGITLYGSGLAPSLQTAPGGDLPTTLGGVSVTINGIPAPLYYVSPSQISAIVPYGVTTAIASIQVTNNGAASNTVSMFVNLTAPGVFTQNQNGLGYAAVQHADYSLVTPSSPAQPGETILVYLTGLGAVNPTVADGALAPSNPLSTASNTIGVYIGGMQATVAYAGLAPGLAGLYQLNVQVPSGLTAGDHDLDIQGPDAYTSEALLPVGSASAASAAISAVHRRPQPAVTRQLGSQPSATQQTRRPQLPSPTALRPGGFRPVLAPNPGH
jgi:uncharacterized protein (TIGR03437 family)